MQFNASAFEVDLKSDDTLFEEIQQLVSDGATSCAYRVKLYGKWHFLKRLKPQYADHPLYRTAFEREFSIGYLLDHPHIVRYVSKGEDSEGFYILTDYVDGETLAQFVARNPALSVRRMETILRQVASALEYLHKRQIVHCDLKPDNILITNNGESVKLIDLGFSYTDCYAAMACGTRSFSSPEQFSHPESADLRSDIYAFGKIAQFLFANRKPPRRISFLMRKATEQQADDRFDSIEELLPLLEYRSTRTWWVAALVVVLIAIAYGAGSYWAPSAVRPTVVYVPDTTPPRRDTVVVERAVQVQHTYKPVVDPLFDEFRGKIRKTYNAAFASFYATYSEMTAENASAIIQGANDAYYRAKEAEFPILAQYKAKNAEYETQLLTICDEEMRRAMDKYQKMQTSMSHLLNELILQNK